MNGCVEWNALDLALVQFEKPTFVPNTADRENVVLIQVARLNRNRLFDALASRNDELDQCADGARRTGPRVRIRKILQ